MLDGSLKIMETIADIASISSLFPRDREKLDELLHRHDETSNAQDLTVYTLFDGSASRRIVAPMNPNAKVGARVRSLGRFHFSNQQLSSYEDASDAISVADRIVLDGD